MNIILVPGLFAKAWSLQSLRKRIEQEGYTTWGAGFWVNCLVMGEYEALVRTLRRVGPAVVIGHSAGGLLAVRAAQEHPDLVLKVIGLGSAVTGKVRCPVPWYEAGSWIRRFLPLRGFEEMQVFPVLHSLLPDSPAVQEWVIQKIGQLELDE